MERIVAISAEHRIHFVTMMPDELTTREGLNLAGRGDPGWLWIRLCPNASNRLSLGGGCGLMRP
jgi:hypothetical protein